MRKSFTYLKGFFLLFLFSAAFPSLMAQNAWFSSLYNLNTINK